ncbi:hypothetical protein [Polynucleobacter sp. es-EL-1]|uniref:hypothetical protein n=1 Tax=Polynucleobacter sp. es-EL-1 TaxID=1855652 RepID=UPI001BFE81EF|nr:hypothetical protein [Polynucleobacter sp. es-EL-1]QWE10893.1 hypothetical protein FD974_01745 [Polynucleobacter sp. es-EL-1]
MTKSSSITKAKPLGGPKTDEGKKIASRNSLKTGTYSKQIVLPNESQQEFDQLVEQFQKDFYPKDAVEMMLVREMAVITWKKLRLERLEHDFCARQLAAQITVEEFLSINTLFTDMTHRFWVDNGVLSGKGAESLARLIGLLKPHRNLNMNAEQLGLIKKDFPFAYDSVLADYYRHTSQADVEPSLEEIVTTVILFDDLSSKYLVPNSVKRMLPYYQGGLQCVKFREQIEEGVIQIRQERLLKMMQLGGVQRASDDLNRAMIRTVNEYRKHHEWRIQNRTEQLPDGDAKQLTAG